MPSSKVEMPHRLRGFVRLLTRHKMPLASWGIGPTKTLQQLWKEYRVGESVFTISRGRLVRKVRRVHPRIYTLHEGNWFRLFETRQVFANGAERIRSTSRSLSEKMLPSETPEQTLARGVSEELGIISLEGWVCIPEKVIRRKIKPSDSYTGLLTKHTDYRFICIMPSNDGILEGYQEVKKGRVTYFEWRMVKCKSPKVA